MARGKKKESLTPEERLQAALVPESEQPYKVPENWICFRFTSLIDIEGGTQPPKSQFIDECREGYIRLVQIRDFASDKYIVFVPDTDKLRHFNEENILIARYGASLGRICTGMSGAYNVALAKTIFSSKVLNRKYVYWMLQSESFQAPLLGISRTAQAGFNKEDLSTFAMPLPPLPEQQRIVDRIESLFAKLDEAKQKAQDALDSFETRKAAILHKAFTGELTAQWRKEHGVGMESWETKKLSEVARLQTGIMKGKHYTGQIIMLPYLRVANVQDGFLNLDEIKEIEVAPEQVERYSLLDGDVLFTEGGDYDKLGRGTVWQGQIKHCLHQNHVFVVRPHADVLNPYFLSHQAGSRYGKQYFLKCSKQTTNLASINSTQLKGFPVLIPALEEQVQIVSHIDDLLAKEQQAKEAAEGVLEQIDLIKKAILARAFRGELGTNDPTEESAQELMKKFCFKNAVERELKWAKIVLICAGLQPKCMNFLMAK